MLHVPNLLRRIIVFFLVFAILTIVSEVLLRLLQVPSYLIPLPTQVFMVIRHQFLFLLGQTCITSLEALAGFCLGNIVAYGLALLFERFPIVEDTGLAFAVTIKATPIIVLAPLFIIWFGNGHFGKCLLAALVCFFPMLVNATLGLRSVEPEVLDYLKSLGATKNQILRYVRIPSSLPYVIAAAQAASTTSIVGAVIAELAGSDSGVGHIFNISTYESNTEMMFATILFVAIAGIIFYSLVSLPSLYLSNRGWLNVQKN